MTVPGVKSGAHTFRAWPQADVVMLSDWTGREAIVRSMSPAEAREHAAQILTAADQAEMAALLGDLG